METIIKILLPVYLIIFFGFVFVWRSYWVWLQTGVNPFRFARTDNAHDTIGKTMSFTWGLCVVIVGIHTISDQAYGFLTPITWLDILPLAIGGLVVLTI